MPLKILLIEDPFSHDTKLADNLPALLGKNSILQTINITAEQAKTPMQVTAKLPLPKGDFDFVLLNIFTGLATRMWLLPINIDPYFDQELSFMLRKLRTIYPNSCISLILPPLPSAERSMYPYCRSSWLGRLSFYNLNSSIQRFYRRHPQKNLEVVPLYLSIAPNDYWPHRLNGQRIRSGHTLTAQGQKKAAETIGAFLVYKSIEQKESDQ